MSSEPRADSVTKSSGKAGVAAVRETLEGSAMPTRKSARKTVTREPTRDAIRIVPLHVSTALAEAATAAQLTYRNGPLLTAVEVCTIFWGAVWQRAPAKTLVGQLNAFFDAILISSLIDQLGEYSVGRRTIGHGRRTTTATITASAPQRSVTDSAIRSFLQQSITTGRVPRATSNTLYFVYVPPGVRVVSGGSASCLAFCGYHDAISRRVFYAVMPYPGCTGCTAGRSVLDALTITSSHELCEAITDPVPGQGWYDDANGEIGDICAWKTKKVGQYTVQLEWSNQANACV